MNTKRAGLSLFTLLLLLFLAVCSSTHPAKAGIEFVEVFSTPCDGGDLELELEYYNENYSGYSDEELCAIFGPGWINTVNTTTENYLHTIFCPEEGLYVYLYISSYEYEAYYSGYSNAELCEIFGPGPNILPQIDCSEINQGIPNRIPLLGHDEFDVRETAHQEIVDLIQGRIDYISTNAQDPEYAVQCYLDSLEMLYPPDIGDLEVRLRLRTILSTFGISLAVTEPSPTPEEYFVEATPAPEPTPEEFLVEATPAPEPTPEEFLVEATPAPASTPEEFLVEATPAPAPTPEESLVEATPAPSPTPEESPTPEPV